MKKLPSVPKKVLHQLARFIGENAGCDFDAVIQSFVIAKPKERFDGAKAFIRGAVNEPLDAGVDQSTGAHNAGFDGCIQGRAGQSIIADLCRRLPQNQDFSMSCRIAIGDGPVKSRGEQISLFVDQTSSNRHFAKLPRGEGRVKRNLHPFFVRGIQASLFLEVLRVPCGLAS